MVVGNGTVGISVERYNAVHKVPDLLTVSMENVSTILMNVYAFHIFTIDVTTQVRAFVYHKAFLSLLRGLMREGGTKKAGAYYKVIVHILESESQNHRISGTVDFPYRPSS